MKNEPKFYEPRIKWHRQVCGGKPISGLLRLFEYTHGEPLAPEIEGLPAQPWMWNCDFEITRFDPNREDPDRDTILVEAAYTAPPMASIHTMLRLGLEQKCRFVIWERLVSVMVDGVKRSVIRQKKYDLNLYRS